MLTDLVFSPLPTSFLRPFLLVKPTLVSSTISESRNELMGEHVTTSLKIDSAIHLHHEWTTKILDRRADKRVQTRMTQRTSSESRFIECAKLD
ncbi:hypothetical protein OUZ56_008339 [Daphnia magna]|uniref:Uncharacterized protein n=1 Tax=Daphnia magna TaxID=35525 RepID=A0ABR0ACN4_9CRUS|nr:hypothetical protein OUZ56_008339 [Daphnia magna]